MKLVRDFFGYIVCQNEKEQGDVMALCELLGLRDNDREKYGFGISPNVLVDETNRTYQQAMGSNGCRESSAADFIRDNF